MHEQTLARFREAWTLLGDELGIAHIEVAVDEVADDFYLTSDAEVFAGLVAEVRRDGGDAVGLVNAETG